jgi:hypothetical protein
MLQKKRLGDDCAGTAGSHGPDRRDDQMSHQDEPIPHTANDDRAWRKLQDYEPVANCGRLSIRHGQVRKQDRLSCDIFWHARAFRVMVIAVGTPVAGRPPHKAERALFRHSASTSGA